MAINDRDSVQLSKQVVDDINQAGESFRSVATSGARSMNKIDNILADSGKKAILLAGLTKMGVDVETLKADKTKIVDMANAIHSTIPALTKG